MLGLRLFLKNQVILNAERIDYRLFRIAMAVCTLDQISKYLIVWLLKEGETLPVAAPILYFTYLKNPGAAFGILATWRILFIVVTVLLLIAVVAFYRMIPGNHQLVKLGLGILLGGAVGNLVDRLRTGYVIDFLDFRFWPVFNLADAAIVIGVVFLCWSLFVAPAGRER